MLAASGPPLLLASASPRRRELLERVGLVLDVRPADVDETPHAGELPAVYVARIALAKARAIACAPGQCVLAADTTVTIDGAILGKAGDAEEATAMLRQIISRTHAVTHQVLTAFVVARDGREVAEVVATDVVMVAADDATLADYVASGEWRGKAGAYAVQGIGAALVREVRGSITNVIGLPLVEVLAALRAIGGPMPRLAAGVAQ